MAADLMIYETGSGGDLSLKNNDIETIEGLTNQVYLALFGGNVEQSTDEDLSELDERLDWWGNEYLSTEFQFNSIFEKTLMEVALNSEGVNTLVNAAKQDLKYLEEYADIEINGAVTQINRFELTVNLKEPGVDSTKIKFIWDGTKNELIEQKII